MGGVLRELEDDLADSLRDSHRHLLQLAHRAMLRLEQLAERLDFMAALPTGLSVEHQTVDVHALVKETIDEVRQFRGRRTMAVNLEVRDGGGGFVAQRLDPRLVRRAVWEIVDNAVRFGRSQADVVLSRDGDTIDIGVHDDGADLPDIEGFRSFEAHRPGRSGLGIGLALAHGGARAIGGELKVCKAADGSNVVRLLLPAK
jgi:signal transduction histidine kinase